MSGDKITSVVKNRSGSPIGTMVFREDGSFSGRMFGTTSFVEVFGESVKYGSASGIVLYPELIPAVPAPPMCEMKFSGNTHQEPAIARVKHHYGNILLLCKNCVNEWLDDADAGDAKEPVELRFLDRVS